MTIYFQTVSSVPLICAFILSSSATLSWLLYLCTRFWNQNVLVHQLFFPKIVLFQLLFWISVPILGSTCQFSPKKSTRILLGIALTVYVNLGSIAMLVLSELLLLLLSHFSICAAEVSTAKLLQSCLTLCDPIDGRPPGSPVPGILQARILEWVAISFSNARKWSHSVVSDSQQLHGLQPTRLLRPWDFPGKSSGVGCQCLLRLSELVEVMEFQLSCFKS